MKNRPLLISLSFGYCMLVACTRSSPASAIQVAPKSSITGSINDSLLHYPVNFVYIQDVDTTHTTLISGEYADTSGKKGSLAMRLRGDTTGRFTGNSLLVTYTDGLGSVYYNTTDTTNYVQIDKYPKTYNGVVSGSFSFMVAGSGGSLKFTNGSIIAIYQK